MRDEVNASTTMLKNPAGGCGATLDHFGLDVALRQLSQEFQDHTGISVLLDCPADLPRLASDLAVFRVAQEAMTNAAKHASPTTVRLSLRLDDQGVTLSVADDGCGFDPDEATSGLGLLGLRERVARLGGGTTLASRPGEGTLLSARIPDDPTASCSSTTTPGAAWRRCSAPMAASRWWPRPATPRGSPRSTPSRSTSSSSTCACRG